MSKRPPLPIQSPDTMSRNRRSPRGRPVSDDGLAILIHQMLMAFERLTASVVADNDAMRREYREWRGLATWAEERLEVAEARVERLEQHAQLPPDPRLDQLRGILTNYQPALDRLKVRPVRGSMLRQS